MLPSTQRTAGWVEEIGGVVARRGRRVAALHRVGTRAARGAGGTAGRPVVVPTMEGVVAGVVGCAAGSRVGVVEPSICLCTRHGASFAADPVASLGPRQGVSHWLVSP